MGVRGLTTFIAKNQETYFKKHKLRDCYIVIDAHSLCAQIYKSYTKSNDSFGGDYDKYGRCLETFFSLLQQCNITPIVIFDGGYEKKKLRTVFSRLKSKIKAVRRANPAQGETVFPLFVREVFRDVVLKLNILTARCDFEADFEIACIARQLNCPVVSYDSDFYIFDVLYIPFPYMDFHATKNKMESGSQHYIACKLYKIESFLKQFGGLDKVQIPLMATILGNDYIGKGSFRNFYSNLKLSRKKVGERGDLQRHIMAVIKWLQEETYDSAVRKVLGRIKKKPRARIAREIRKITQGYICTESEILKFLNISSGENLTSIKDVPVIDLETIETDSESENDSEASEAGSDNENSDDNLSEGDETIDITTIQDVKRVEYPQWFEVRYRRSEYPTLFMDLLSLHSCFYMPQMENTYNMHTLQVSLPVLRAIAKILLADRTPYFTYWARNEYGRVKKYNVEMSDLDLPDLNQLTQFNCHQRFQTFVQVLEMGADEIKFISYYPAKWQLYFYSLVFWARHADTPIVTLCHIYSIVLCLISIDIVDNQIGHYRLKGHFLNKYSAKLQTLTDLRNKVTATQKEEVLPQVNNYLGAVNKDDCILFLNSFISNFAMDDKLQSNGKLFNIFTVDAFAQFQNCLYFIKHLNALLLYPVPDMNIANFFNGTFLYNLHSNLESRNDIDVYVDLLLRLCPTLYRVFQSSVCILKSLLELKPSETSRKKRRRKRKKRDSNKEELNLTNDMHEINNSNSEIDENNIYSVLRFVE